MKMEDIEKFALTLSTVVICYTAYMMLKVIKKRTRKKRSHWVKEILMKRKEEGTNAILVPRLISDTAHYRNYFRMSKESFECLYNLVESDIRHLDTRLRKCITPIERLALTLRFLASGNSLLTIEKFHFK
jgi:hypothetical protein